ncbi:DUF6443 domain-containing protein [Parapedobacter tibetensis]|uniref:DUF6443 domain-containing protein n=1 Tax=Parapedobacter tibetensis TaxID=2972951 RepID=UPI00214DB7A9|nr:DUF6443 domain-containing protein [Parapedobacter tibetensis]
MRYPIIALLFVCLSITASGQLVLNKPGATGQYSAPTTVTLSPGFTSTGNFHAFIAPAATGLGNAASNNQNYIQKTVYLRGFGDTPPSTLTVADAMRDITYYDGLGREMQEVGVKASGGTGYRDVVAPIAYDAFGRRDKDYLPYGTGTGAGGAFKAGAVTQQATYYNGPPTGVVKIDPISGTTLTPSFAPRKYEPSPLDRVQEQGFPGDAWQLGARTSTGGRTVMVEYGTNDAGSFGISGRRVALYGVSLSAQGTPTLALASNAIYSAGELYVTITRDENWLIGDGRNGTVEEYIDKQGRVVLKRTYDAGAVLSTYYVYDDFGRLAFVLTPGAAPDRGTLPAVGTTRNTWLANHVYHYRYDGRGRPVEKRVPGKGREFFVYNKLDQIVATQDSAQRMKSPQQWVVTKYDAHGRVVRTGFWNHGATAGQDYRGTVQTQVDAQTGSNAWEERPGNTYTDRSWPTGGVTVLTEQFFDDYDVAGLPGSYDKSGEYSKLTKGLPTVSRVNVLGTGQYLWTAVYYDDRGNMVREIGQHYKGGSSGYTANNYDDLATEYSFTGQVLTSTRRHYASGSLSATVRTEHTHDHRGRPLDTWKTLNTGTRTLIARNGYNDIGQLRTKSLHSTDGTSFGETVTYAYNPRGWLSESVSTKFRQYLKYNESITGVVRQFNGNISRQEWQHLGQGTQYYNYTYDKLNRLATGSGSGSRSENPEYDPMGNIQRLTRDGSAMDYEYLPLGSSRLNRITGVGTAYTYDGNGNMTRDGRLNRTIAYNELNLPKTVSGTNPATYTYDATGRKLRSVTGSITTDYINGVEWEGTTLSLIHTEEGRILPTGKYDYVLKDHLGNARSGFASDALTTVNLRTDYYPFGLQHPTGNVVPATKNRYLYNGKEQQDVTGYYDYGARLYDPVIGRWGVVDPLAEDFDDVSPYNYALNNPLRYIDPDGMSASDTTFHLPPGDEIPAGAKPGDIIVMEGEGGTNTSTSLLPTASVTGRQTVSMSLAGSNISPYSGPLGLVRYILTGGEEGGYRYDINGRNLGPLPTMGYPMDIGRGNPASIGKVIKAAKGSKWTYGSFKSSTKWANQLTKRGWTEKQIGEAISKGKQFKAMNNVNKANGATRYVHPKTGQSVVTDNVTNELLHVGGPGFKY